MTSKFEANGSTPKFGDTAYQQRLINLAVASLGFAQEALAAALDDLRGRETYRFKLHDKIKQQDVSEALRLSKQPRHVEIRRGLWVYLHQEFPDLIADLDDYIVCGHSNPVSVWIHRQLYGENVVKLDEKSLISLEGLYKIYRRCFNNPDELIVSRLECGVDGNPGIFRLRSFDTGNNDIQEATGSIIPYKNSLLFQGSLKGHGGPFIFYFSRVSRDGLGRVHKGAGVLLAGSEGYNSSAFPVFMARSTDDFDSLPVNLSRLESENLKDYHEIQMLLSRGFVDWR